MLRVFALFIFLFVSTDAGAAKPMSMATKMHLTVESVEVFEKPVVSDERALTSWVDELNEANLILDSIINMGKKVWKIVEANKPVVNTKFDSANALPEGALKWTQLEGWSRTEAREFQVVYKNAYGMRVADYTFRVLFTPGGNVAGTGRYLANVTVVPSNLEVAWGYTFNSEATVPTVVNVGTRASPIGGAEVLVTWKVDTVVKHAQGSMSFFVRGDGGFEVVSGQ